MLNWGNRFNICCFLDNHQYELPRHRIECLLGAGSLREISANAGAAFASLQTFLSAEKDWVFGHLGYDLKNELETLSSSHPDGVGFPDLFFFIPQIVAQLTPDALIIGVADDSHENVYNEIAAAPASIPASPAAGASIRSRFSAQEYMDTVERIRQHILKGDCYEMNFCQEFYAEKADIHPLKVYGSLSRSSPNPFSAYYKLGDKYLLCMSPERYLNRSGHTILSQPIKGTSRRDAENEARDALSKDHLRTSEKERSENIMVVDLVRNDLSRVCRKGTVKVDELCGIYSFPQVHQMISTVSGELEDNTSFADIIKATFPMGSMTGAPKKRVMQLIEQYERSKRGLFSGSIGYIHPEGDFDFNVVIRSIAYNAATAYLSFHTGSAITFQSDPAGEYQECLLKAEAIKKVLE